MSDFRLVLLSHPRLTAEVDAVARAHFPHVNLHIVDAQFADAVRLALELEQAGQVDCFITGGANAVLVQEAVDAPVVSFRVDGGGLLVAVAEAARHGPAVPVITFRRPVLELRQLAPVLNVRVDAFTYQELSELPLLVRRLAGQGYKAVIGSGLVVDAAEQLGLTGILIYSRQAIIAAIEDAYALCVARQREAERTERLKAILDFAYSGIVAADADGVISAFNPAAERILGIGAAEALGKGLHQILPVSRLGDVLHTGVPELNQIFRGATGPILTNRVPILVRGEVRGVVATFHDAASIQQAEQKLRSSLAERGLTALYTFDHIAGSSPAIAAARERAEKYSCAEASVLVLGESGTGKELFAQAIHNASRRAAGPFVAVNCAALPESLLESELFGYEEGAFTGSRRGGKAGLFELSHGGTILLDEIGEMPLAIQARLLRVLQQRQIMRIGSDKIVPVDIRVIAATNRDLASEVRASRFRPDLYYRLNVLTLNLPPLRERVEDIPQLAALALGRIATPLARAAATFLPELIPLATGYAWPGNVRELENMVERVAGVAGPEADGRTAVQLLAAEMTAAQGATAPAPTRSSPSANWLAVPGESCTVAEVQGAIAAAGGNRAAAARLLGISRTTLYRKLKCTH